MSKAAGSDYENVWMSRVRRCRSFCDCVIADGLNRGGKGESYILAVSCGMVIEARCGGKWRAVRWMVRQILLGYLTSFIVWRWRHLGEEEFAKKLEGME